MSTIARIHPGEILKDYLQDWNISAYRLAKDIDVPSNRITRIIKGETGISSETALLLSAYFGTSEVFWINLQSHYDAETAKDRLRPQIQRIRAMNEDPQVPV